MLLLRILAGAGAASAAWWLGLRFLFGPAQTILADPGRQSDKFLAVFTTIEPLPRMATAPWVLPVGLLLIGLLHSVAFAAFGSRLAGTTRRRGAAWGLLAWLLMVPWFEFYLPWNVMHEPFGLVLLEAGLWFVLLQGVGAALAVTHGEVGRGVKHGSVW